MNKFLALTAALGFAGTASAQVYSTPAQPMPSGVVQSGAVLPATVTGGVVTGQPYMLNPSVTGGTVVGMPTMAGTVYSQPYMSTSTGGSVVSGSYMANGSYPQPYMANGMTTYPAATVYSQPAMMGNRMVTTTAAPAGATTGVFSQNGVVTRVVTTPVRVTRRLFRR